MTLTKRFLAFAAILWFTACGPAGKNSGTELIFEGTLPCADCPGIIMEVRLDTANHTYIRNMTYLEASENGKDASFSASGTYTTEQGYKEDESALLYVLANPPSGTEQVFLAKGDSAIIALDGNREIIQADLNFTLTKKR